MQGTGQMTSSTQDLHLIIKSRIPLVKVESHEEGRVIAMIRELAVKTEMPMYAWSVTEGLKRYYSPYSVETPAGDTVEPLKALAAIRQTLLSGIYVFCDFHPYWEDSPQVVRLIKEIALAYNYLGHTLIFLSHRLAFPPALKRYGATFEIPMPDAEAIERIVREEAAQWSRDHHGQKVRTNARTLKKLVRNLMGLPLSDARRLARQTIYNNGAITESDLPEVNRAKFELLDMGGVLSFEYETSRFSDLGGLSNLKHWLNTRKAAFHRESNAMALDPPKGILLLGVQGSGKSMAAKAVAGAWGVPLLRLDFGTLYNKYFGESEKNLRQSLKMAEIMAPCVLWLDEIEKGIATDANDAGTSRRILGTLLTWMAEKKQPCFIVATSNDISALPPELIRKGRLDEIFFVDLPDAKTRAEIFSIHLAKRGLSPQDFSLDALADKSRGFSGAEIEQAVVAGLYNALAQDQPLDTRTLLEECANTRPLSVVMAEQIEHLRQWAAGRTVPAH